jgi:hypothetical protein
MPQIFINHSAKDSFAKQVRDGVAKKLSEMKGFDVLLDQDRINPGEAWRAKLYRWLGSCHGAVILFSRDALQSDWVRTETNILT